MSRSAKSRERAKAKAAAKAKAKARVRAKRGPAAEQGSAKEEPEPASVGYWAVAYLDLMGFRGLLRSADVYPLPSDQPERDAMADRIVRSWHFRRRLLHGIETFQSATQEAPQGISDLPIEFQKLAARWRAVQIKTFAMGDSVAMEMALGSQLNHFPPRALDTMLTAVCSAALMQLVAGGDDIADTLPLRGGVDVGTGAVFDGELYSAALAKAVELEESADFPRVVVGDRLLDYLRSLEVVEDATPTGAYVRALATGARGFLFHDDTDGKVCIDFLGEKFRDRCAIPADHVRAVWRFVQKATECYAGNSKLIGKYRWLERYVRSRLPLWGLTP